MVIKRFTQELMYNVWPLLQRLLLMTILLLAIIGIEILFRFAYKYVGPALNSRALEVGLDVTLYFLHALAGVVALTYTLEIMLTLVRRVQRTMRDMRDEMKTDRDHPE